MLPEGNGSCFYIEKKKGSKKKRLSFFYIENGKTQGNAFIETSEQSIEKKSARMPSFPLLSCVLACDCLKVTRRNSNESTCENGE